MAIQFLVGQCQYKLTAYIILSLSVLAFTFLSHLIIRIFFGHYWINALPENPLFQARFPSPPEKLLFHARLPNPPGQRKHWKRADNIQMQEYQKNSCSKLSFQDLRRSCCSRLFFQVRRWNCCSISFFRAHRGNYCSSFASLMTLVIRLSSDFKENKVILKQFL